MNPLSKLKSALRITAIGLTFGLAAVTSNPAMAKNNWLEKLNPGPINPLPGNPEKLLPGGGGPPAPKILKTIFRKSGQQLDCKHVRFRIRLALWGTPGFWDNPASVHVGLITSAVQDLTDKLPKGLSWVSASIQGDLNGFPLLSYQSDSNPNDTIKVSGIKFSADNSDGIGDPDMREWNLVVTAKIDPAEFPAPKTIENQAFLKITTAFGITNAKTNDPALGDPVNWKDGQPTKVNIDLTDCDDPEGDPGGDPEGEPCIKLEKGEVECEGGAPVPFTYKMPVGPELEGTTIELVSLTPGVIVNPAFQIVPPGGGILEWDLVGAAKGMTIHLLTNNVKQVGPADFGGLATCCTEEIIIDIPEDIPCDDDEKEPDLEVKKKALVTECDKETGDCKFRIRTKNVGDGPYNGELVLDEWQIPEKANISAGPNAPWSCNIPFGLDHYVCKHPATTLNPGEFKDLLLTFKPGPAWIGDTIKNCARFNYTEAGKVPFGDLTNDKSCDEICIKGSPGCPDDQDEQKPELEIRKFHTNTGCTVGPGINQCYVKYSIIIHNFGDAAYNGELNVKDSFSQKPDNVEFNPIPPWNCATVDGQNFDCKHPGANIAPSGQLILTVKGIFNNPDEVENKEIENCAKLEEAEPGKEKDCATGNLPAPADDDDKPNLTIEKSCTPGVLGGLISCRIALRNNGTSPPRGLIRVFDVNRIIGTDAPIVAEDVIPDGREWQCEGAPASDLACMIEGRHLPRGTIRYFDVKFKLESVSQRYQNCATAHQEPVAGDRMILIGKSCVEGGVDIRVEKTGDAICRKDEDCSFNLTFKNTGEADFSGSVKFVDAIGLADPGTTYPIVSISPPLPCDEQPTSIPFVCKGNLTLGAGESTTHTITTRFSKEDERMRNCAAIVDGDIITGNAGAVNRGEAREENLAAGIIGCHIFSVGAAKKDQCTPPLVMNDNGVCVCPPNTKWNGRRCVGDTSIPPVVDPDPTPLCVPGRGEIRTKNNRCVCRAGYIRKGPDLCVPPKQGCTPGPNEYKDRKGNCVCKRGFTRDNYGRCVKIPPACKLGPNEFRNSLGQCVCKPGFTRNNKGICVKPPQGCKPGPNEYKDQKGNCVCKRGYTRNNYGICVKPPQGCTPGPNEYKNQKGQCVCKRGFKRNSKGVCVKPPQGCKPGPNEYKDQKGNCVCKRGYTRNNYGMCVKIPDSKPPCYNGNLIKRGKGWFCVCPKGWSRKAIGNKGGASCSKPLATPKPPCYGGKLNKFGKGWICSCPKGWKRTAIGNKGGARCSKPPVSTPKPPCYSGKLIKRGKGWYCVCNKGWKRTAIGNKGGARCTPPSSINLKTKKPVLKKNNLKINPNIKLKQNKVIIK